MNSESTNGSLRTAARDAMGGIAAAAMVLPQAMAFGVALLSPYGVPAGRAALSGLVCASALCLFSGLAGGTKAIVSSPTGPMLVMAGSVISISASGSASPDQVLAVLAALVVLTGVGQIVIGATGGGRLIKFIPHSVVVGFLTGSAVLMLISQYSPLANAKLEGAGKGWFLVPAATAAATLLLAAAAPKITKRVPATIVGLVGGTIFFHAVSYASPVEFPENWSIGALPAIGLGDLGFDASVLSSLPWPALIAGALAASVLASVDTLLTSVLADLETGERHDARKELMGQGVGHIASGLLGGMAGAGTTGATLVSATAGGRRWAGVAAGAGVASVVLFAGGVGAILPVSVLAGIIIKVAAGMLEYDIVTWLGRRRSRMDAVIAILVAAVTVGYDLLVAVAIGVAIAIVLYLRAQVKAPVIHRRFSGRDFHSVCQRTHAQKNLLREHADEIVICELRGDLFFATADRLFEELLPDLDSATWLILNLRRVRRVDITGAKILQQIAERIKREGGEIVFCEVHKGIGIGHDVGKAIRKLSPDARDINIRTFVNTDEALEFVENCILQQAGPGESDGPPRTRLEETDLCSDLEPELVEAISSATRNRNYKKGDVIFEKGDQGDALFFLLKGEVDIRLDTTKHHYKRLAKYIPGTVFGEVAFLKPGERSAAAVAATDCEIAELRFEDFLRFAGSHSDGAVKFLIELGRKQSEELRWSAHEIQRLGDW